MSGPTEPADPGRPALDELIREMRRLRNRAGLSQRALAAKMGYVREYVTLGERGVRLPSREFLVRYAHALNATRTLLPLYQVARDEHQASTDAAHATRRQHALGLTDWEAAQMQALMESQAPTEQAGTGGGPPEKRATAEGGQVVDGAAVDTAPTATSPQMVSAQRRAGSTSWIISLEDGRPRIVPINGAAASVAATLPPSSLVDPDERERVVRIIDDPRRADLPLARDLGELLAQYRVLEDAIGPRRVMRPILPLCGLVDDIIRGARADAQQPLLRLAAQFEQFTGWLWVDQGNHRKARRSYDAAIARATEGGDQALARYLLACKSEHALTDGRLATALTLAQEAQDERWILTPAVRAWAADLEARAWATLGKSDECERKLGDAARLLAESKERGRENEPPWVYHFVDEALSVHRGMCYAELGNVDAATAAFDQALGAISSGRVRDRAYYLSYLVTAHMRADDPNAAAAVAREAAQLAIVTGSQRVLSRLQRLHKDLSSEWPAVPSIQQLGELLSDLPEAKEDSDDEGGD